MKVLFLSTVLLVSIFAWSGEGRFQQLVEDVKSGIVEIDVAKMEELRKAHPNLHIIDVREHSEWDQGHLKGAVHLTRGVLEWQLEQHVPNADDPIVLYCGGGNRSALSAETVQRMGYSQVYSLAGGFWAIKQAGLEVEQ